MVMKSHVLSVASFIVAGFLLGACTKSGAGNKEEPRSSAPEKAPPLSAAPETLSADRQQSIRRALDAYEQVRGQLARDEVAGVAASASVLEQAANEAAGKAPENLRVHLEGITSSARSLKDMPKNDAGAVRQAFGDVSRSVVALLAAEPSLQQGRHVFECPMAQGYKKWVQPTANLSNPYMGTRMPTCGSASEWTTGG